MTPLSGMHMEQKMKKRIWELDFIRGGGILIVMSLHFCLAIFAICHFWPYEKTASLMQLGRFFNIYGTPFVKVFVQIGLAILFILSGISSTLSKSPLKRFLKLFIASVFVTVISIFYNVFSGLDYFIAYGAIHMYATCALLYLGIRKLNFKWHYTLLLLSFLVWIMFRFILKEDVFPSSALLYSIGMPSSYVGGLGEHFILFNYFFYYMIGIILGNRFYKNQTSLLPNLECGFTRFFQKIGKISGYIYVSHFAIMPLICYMICWIVSKF